MPAGWSWAAQYPEHGRLNGQRLVLFSNVRLSHRYIILCLILASLYVKGLVLGFDRDGETQAV